MADALLTVSNLETSYGPIMAIRGVSFTVPERAIVTILGANGAGKTTILKTVSGAMDAQKGTVTFAGREIQGRDPDQVARLGISHVPEGREVFPLLTVRENLMMGAYARRDAGGVAEDLDLVYGYFPILKDRASQRAGQLSGGDGGRVRRHGGEYEARRARVDRPRPGDAAAALPPRRRRARRAGRHARKAPRDLARDHLARVRRAGPARRPRAGRPRPPAPRR